MRTFRPTFGFRAKAEEIVKNSHCKTRKLRTNTIKLKHFVQKARPNKKRTPNIIEFGYILSNKKMKKFSPFLNVHEP